MPRVDEFYVYPADWSVGITSDSISHEECEDYDSDLSFGVWGYTLLKTDQLDDGSTKEYYASTLTCNKCGYQYEYQEIDWIPPDG